MSKGFCSVKGCNEPLHAKGFCHFHYDRNYRNGTPGPAYHIHYKTNRRVKQNPLFETWRAMRKRCYYEKHPEYNNYGGRGIKICDRWLGKDGFDNFLKDVGPRPEGRYPSGRPLYTLDRIDVNGDYCPSNCRWTTQKEQCNNTRFNHVITYNGKTMTVTQWAEKLGIKTTTLFGRIRKHPGDIKAQLKELFQ